MSITKNVLRRTQGGITGAVYMLPAPFLAPWRLAPPWCVAGGVRWRRPDPKSSAMPSPYLVNGS
jgi:hypothetical protein